MLYYVYNDGRHVMNLEAANEVEARRKAHAILDRSVIDVAEAVNPPNDDPASRWEGVD